MSRPYRGGFGSEEAARIYEALRAAGYCIGLGDVRCATESGLLDVLAGRDQERRDELRALIGRAIAFLTTS